jgi:RHS repeat-associated protein
LGGIGLVTYDAAGNATSTTTESNNTTSAPNVVTTQSYDADNRLISTTTGSGGTQPETTLTSYDPNGHAFCTVSPNAYAQGSTKYQCPAWQTSWIKTPPSPSTLYSSTPSSAQANDVTTTFFNVAGKVVQSDTPDIATTVTAITGDGQTYCTSDPTNVATYLAAHPSASYPYNCPVTPPSNPPATGSNPGYVTTIFDAAGHTLSSTNAAGDTTAYAYDAGGHVLTTTDPRGSVTTNCYYDQNATGQCAHSAPAGTGTGDDLYTATTPATAADPSGETTSHTYFPSGALHTAATPGATTTYATDALDDITATSYSAIGSGYTAPANTSATFNTDRTPHTITDATGTTTYGYDANGDVTSKALVATGGLSNATTSYGYYTTGAPATVTYPAYPGNSSPVVTYAYDADGALTSSIDWLGNKVTFTHDADGNTTNQANAVSTSNPNGTSSTAQTYDNADLPTAGTTAVNQTCGGAENITQSFSGSTGSRNADGQLTATTTSFSATCSGQTTATRDYSYNVPGQVTYQGTTPQGAAPANFAYDASGSPTTFATRQGGTLDAFTQAFDAAGEPTGQTPVSSGTASSFTYDTLGDQTAVSGAASATYAYNGIGQMASATVSAGTATYLYNSSGLEAATTSPTPAAWGTPALVDSGKSITAVRCVSSSFCRAIDNGGNLLTWNGSAWANSGSIDSTRALSGISCPTTSFCAAVDGSGYVTTWNGSSWSAATHSDTKGALTGVSCASSTFCAAVDNAGYALTWNGSAWSAPTTVKNHAVLNAVSCATSGFCVAGASSGSAYTYNGSSWSSGTDIDGSRSVKAVSCPAANFCAAVDGSGYVTTWNGSVWSTPSNVDGTHSVNGVTCISSTACTAVDGSGNVLTYNGTWSGATSIDSTRALNSVSCPTTSFCAATDASGYATLLRTGTATSQLTWDTRGSMPNVLSDGTYDYLYGPEGSPVEEVALSSSTPTYMSYVTSDSTWVSTNAAGDLTGLYGYDAFGSLSNGTSTSPFGFGGQYTDASTGFGVNRARFFNSTTGSFTTRDSAFASTDTAYTYAGGDPVNGGDPSGLCSDSGGKFLVSGPCEWSSKSWAQNAINNIHSQYAPPPWWQRGLEADASFGAGIGNVVTQAVTLGHVHISNPFCQFAFAYNTGQIYAVVASTALGFAELDSALAAADATDAAYQAAQEARLAEEAAAQETGGAAGATRAFAHGTAPGSAADIVNNGLSESAARAGSQGGLYDSPGSFHTIEINPANPSDALEIAHGYGLLQADPASVVVSELPGSVFQQMLDQGLATVEKVPGLGEQTVFHPSGYDVFNNVSNRYFFTPGGG